jgi:hypothetical protein
VEGEVLKYEATAASEIPKKVKEVLRKSEIDENIIIGILKIERANMIPDNILLRVHITSLILQGWFKGSCLNLAGHA